MEKVQPLVHIYHPRNGRVHSLPDALYGIDDDDDIQNQIKSHKGLDGAGQIAALCKYAADNGYTIRAVGTGSSWSRLTHTRDILVVMTDLNKILTVPKILEDSQSEDSEMETTEMKSSKYKPGNAL